MKRKIKKIKFLTKFFILLLTFLSSQSILAVNISPIERTFLMAAEAELVGGDIKLENTRSDSPNICYWASGCSASWNIQVETAGTYKVVLDYARASTQSDLPVVVEVGDKTIAYQLTPTGNWEDYIELEIGEIELSVDDMSLAVTHGENLKVDLMNLRLVALERIETIPEESGVNAGTEIFILVFTGTALIYAGVGIIIKKKNKKTI